MKINAEEHVNCQYWIQLMISKIQNVINSQSIYLQIQTILLGKSLLRNNNKVDSLWECAIKQTVMTVAQWRRNQIIRGPLVIGVLFNLDFYRRMQQHRYLSSEKQHCCLKQLLIEIYFKNFILHVLAYVEKLQSNEKLHTEE